jgi:hypothetical protein
MSTSSRPAWPHDPLDQRPAGTTHGKVVEGRHRLPAGLHDLRHDRSSDRLIMPTALDVNAGVVHDNVGAPLGEQQGVCAAETTAGPGHERNLPVEPDQPGRSPPLRGDACRTSEATVFSIDITSAAHVAWDITQSEMTIMLWTPASGLQTVMQRY